MIFLYLQLESVTNLSTSVLREHHPTDDVVNIEGNIIYEGA
jgi:hypothetical protein